MGLKHPFEGAVQLQTQLDFSNYTIMSYTHPEGAITFDPETLKWNLMINKPMVYDVLAIQYLYGADNVLEGSGGRDALFVAAGNDTLIGGQFATCSTEARV